MCTPVFLSVKKVGENLVARGPTGMKHVYTNTPLHIVKLPQQDYVLDCDRCLTPGRQPPPDSRLAINLTLPLPASPHGCHFWGG